MFDFMKNALWSDEDTWQSDPELAENGRSPLRRDCRHLSVLPA